MSILSKIKNKISNRVRNKYFDLFFRDNIAFHVSEYLSCNRVDGSCYYFGVGSGIDFLSLYKRLKDRSHYVFDSFCGLPIPKDDFNGKYKKGKYSFPLAAFKKLLSQNNISEKDCIVTVGYFSDTLSKCEIKKRAALVVLDCDLYESTKSALEYSKNIISRGTIILACEYFNYGGDPSRGMQRAVNEFKEEVSLIPWRAFGCAGMAFICQK